MDTGIHRLPVWATATASYGALLGHLAELARLALWPATLCYGIFLAAYSLLGRGVTQTGPMVALGLAFAVLMVPFTVSWYRLVLLGPGAVAGSRGLTVGRREGRFFLWALVVSLLGLLAIGLAVAVIVILLTRTFKGIPTRDIGVEGIILIVVVSVLLGVPALAWACRLCLALPSVAVDAGGSLRKALRLSRGNAFRITGVLLLASVPPGLAFVTANVSLMILLAVVLGPDWGVTVGIAVARFVEVVQLVVTGALGASALALSYRLLELWQEEDGVFAVIEEAPDAAAETDGAAGMDGQRGADGA